MQLCQRLLTEHTDRLNGNVAPLHRAILYCVTSSSATVRLNCAAVLKKIVGSLGGAVIARAVMRELQCFLDAQKTVTDVTERIVSFLCK